LNLAGGPCVPHFSYNHFGVIMRNKSWLSIIVILMSAVSLYAADFYVDTDGLNHPDNGSEDSPFRTVTYALAVADTTDGSPHTIYVAEGRYSGLELFPLPMLDNVSIIGEDRDDTILDASNSNTSVIAAIDVSNWSIQNLTITGGYEIQGGGLLVTLGSDVLLKNLHITGNTANYSVAPGTQGEGGGLFLYECDNVVVENVLFNLNSAITHGGAIMATRCSPVLNNVSLHHNTCYDEPASSAIYSDGIPGNEVIVKNSIIWGNPGMNADELSITGEVDITYSLVENTSGTPYPGTGNDWFNPLFEDYEGQDYRVLEGSWIVDAGDPTSDYGNEPEPNGGRVNLGYLGNTDETIISGSATELRNGRWSFIGVPVDPSSGDAQVLFGDDLNDENTGSDTWRFMRWSGLLNQFIRYGEPEADGVERGNPPAIEPGLGYLMNQVIFGRTTIDVPGYALEQETAFSYELESTGSLYINMMANPYPYTINHSDCYFSSGAVQHSFEEAAQAGYVNRWMYTLDADRHFVPTLGYLDPWEGAIIVTLDDVPTSWNIEPERNDRTYGDPLAELDWGLYLSVAATDSNGDPLAIDAGHIFGVGRDSDLLEDDVDPYDAYSLDLLNALLTFHWETDSGVALFHDFRKVEDGYYPMWHGVINGVPSLQDSVQLSIEGIENDTLEAYPDFDYGFVLKNDLHETLIEDLRDSTTFMLPLDTLEDGSKFLSFYIYATHPEWEENSVEEPTSNVPTQFTVESIYPNPFNASTSVVFSIYRQGSVDLKVFDVLGREVDKQSLKGLAAGRHRINWTPKNIASGVYFMQLQSAGITEVKKVVLVR